MNWGVVIFFVLAMPVAVAFVAAARRIAAKLDRDQRACWPYDEGGR